MAETCSKSHSKSEEDLIMSLDFHFSELPVVIFIPVSNPLLHYSLTIAICPEKYGNKLSMGRPCEYDIIPMIRLYYMA